MRSPYSSVRWSWVTTSTARRVSLATSASRAITALPFSLSRAAVGSSARITDGEPASARAIDTRCFSPPDSLLGEVCARCDRPTASSASQAR